MPTKGNPHARISCPLKQHIANDESHTAGPLSLALVRLCSEPKRKRPPERWPFAKLNAESYGFLAKVPLKVTSQFDRWVGFLL